MSFILMLPAMHKQSLLNIDMTAF